MKSVLVLIVLVVMLFGCSKLTKENYSKINIGSEYLDVVKTLGTPDNCSEGVFLNSCTWGDDKKHIKLNFVKNRVIYKSSHNIK